MNFSDLFAALCLVLVIEGLFLLVAPAAWKRVAERLASTPERALRTSGGMMVVACLVVLQFVR